MKRAGGSSYKNTLQRKWLAEQAAKLKKEKVVDPHNSHYESGQRPGK